MQTLKWKFVGDTMLIVHAKEPPADADWAGLMRACAELGKRLRKCLVFAEVSLTPKQRKEIADVVSAARTQAVAVVTRSQITQHIITAIGWVTGIHKGFDPKNLDDALSFLGVSGSERHELLETARRFEDELAGAKGPPAKVAP